MSSDVAVDVEYGDRGSDYDTRQTPAAVSRFVENNSGLTQKKSSQRYGKCCWSRAVALFAGDLAAFAVASFLVGTIQQAVNHISTWPVTYGRIEDLGLAWHGWETLLVLAVLLSHLSGRGHYTRRIPFWTEAGDLLRSSFIALLFDFVLATKIYGVAFSTAAVSRWILFVPLALLMRFLTRTALARAGLWSLRTIIVSDGDTAATQMAHAALSSDRSLGYDVVEIVDFAQIASSSAGVRPWHELMERTGADFVVLALSGTETAKARWLLASLALARIPFAVMPTVGGLPVFGFDAQYFFSHDVMLLVNRNNLMRPLNRAIKSAFDYGIAFLLFVWFAPFFGIIALLIKRDGGPVFFRQQRIGAGGQPFTCFKFRTMVPNSAELLTKLFDRDPDLGEEWRATQKLRVDPRVTAVGRFLRATSLDELPQLLNVLRGDMSLVGPRPIVAEEIARYGSDICFYAEAKPGITGLWQVSGRSNTSYKRRVELDVWYVKNWTLWHDIAILLKTLPAVLCQRGAV